MLLKGYIMRDKCFGKNHAILKVNISVRHPVSQEELFAVEARRPIDEARLLVTPEILSRQGKTHVSLSVRGF